MAFTPNGALVIPLPKIEGIGGHHMTLTGDPAGGIMKCHDTFQVGSQSVNVSGPQYNGLNGPGNEFNPSPQTAQAFGDLFK